jgi:hypothetical protein
MTTTAVFGCTGTVGAYILAMLLVTNAFPSVKTISKSVTEEALLSGTK